MSGRFRLIKAFSNFKVGKVFDSYNGLVRGVYCRDINMTINFDNTEYFIPNHGK